MSEFKGKERRTGKTVGRRREDTILALAGRMHLKASPEGLQFLKEGRRTINDFTLVELIREGDDKAIMSFVQRVSEKKEPCNTMFYRTAIEYFLKKRAFAMVEDVMESAATARSLDANTAIMAVRTILSPTFVDEMGKPFIASDNVNHVSNILGYLSGHNCQASKKSDVIGCSAIFEAAVDALCKSQVDFVSPNDCKAKFLKEFYIHSLDAMLPPNKCIFLFEKVFDSIVVDASVPNEEKADLMFEMIRDTLRSHVPYDKTMEKAKKFIKARGSSWQLPKIEQLQACHNKKKA